MGKVVEAKAWNDADTARHARNLLGAWLCVRGADGLVRRARITETEAYHGPEDRACHASKGRTARTEVMFGPAGRWYVYFIYGMHEMLNLVTWPENWPAAVLIRGVEGVTGPGRVTKTLGIGRALNGTRADVDGAAGAAAWIETAAPTDEAVREADVLAGPRVGVDYAGPEWAAKPWRFRWMARWTPPGKSAAGAGG
jgi:DNA-3-methyladenine glycosylase